MNSLVPERLERGRLLYERIAPEHGAELRALMSERLVLETLWPFSYPYTDADHRSGLRQWIEHWDRHGFGLWVLRDAETGAFVGRGGLEHIEIEGESFVEVAWAVTPSRWRQGLATELAQTSVDAAFTALELDELIAITLPDNVASRRVMEKAGFTYARDVTYAGMPHVFYRQDRRTRRARC